MESFVDILDVVMVFVVNANVDLHVIAGTIGFTGGELCGLLAFLMWIFSSYLMASSEKLA